MTIDKLSNDPVLKHFDYVQKCIDQRWYKGTVGGRGDVWKEFGKGDYHCLVTPRSGSVEGKFLANILMRKVACERGYRGTIYFNNAPERTKEEVFDFLDECKRIRVAELLEAAVT